MSKPLIPFALWPAFWGLKGKQREIAKAEYELIGEELDRRLVQLNHDDVREAALANLNLDKKYGHVTPQEYEYKKLDLLEIEPRDMPRAKLDLDNKYHLITTQEYEYKKLDLLEIEPKEMSIAKLDLDRKFSKVSKEEYDYARTNIEYADTPNLSLAILELDFKYHKLTKQQYEKSVASLKGEAWVGVIGSEYSQGESSDQFAFELDWNDQFIIEQKAAGYTGLKDEDIVQQWFEERALDDLVHVVGEDFDPEEMPNQRIIPKTRIKKESIEANKTRHS